MPRGMTPEAKRFWRETVDILNRVQDLLTIADGPVLADYCEICAEHYRIMRTIDVMTRRKMRDLKRELEDGLKKLPQAKDPKLLAEVRRQLQSKMPTAMEVSTAITEKYATRLALLRNQKKVFEREFGLTPSGRRSILMPGGGTKPASEDPLDFAFYGGRPKLVAV